MWLSKGGASLSSKVRQPSMKTVQTMIFYTISTYSFTVEVEVVPRSLLWIATRSDSRTTHAIVLTDSISLLQKVTNGIGSPDWGVSASNCGNSCGCTAPDKPHAGVTENDPADRLVCFLEDLKCRGASDTTHGLRASDITSSTTHRERHKKGKHLTTFLERTKNGRHQSDKYWNCFKSSIM